MATMKERFLALLDQFIGWDHQYGETESEHTQDFYVDLGVKMAIVDNNGHVRALGGSCWVTHLYDGKGNLVSRTSMRKTLKKDEHIVYGNINVYEAYRDQPCL